jgi:uridine kinase
VRTAAGQLSPEGYYHDSFDYPSLRGSLLTPLKSAPLPLRLPAAKFDWKSNGAIEDAFVDVFAGTIVLFEGGFLLRPELRDFWDYRIFVQIRAETSLARGLQRDSYRLGGEAATRERYLKRYLPGQKLYLSSVNPDRLADLVIENDDVEAPVLRVR